MHEATPSSPQNPLHLAALSFSLLQTHSFEALLPLCSSYLKDRYSISQKFSLSLFTWEEDQQHVNCIQRFLEEYRILEAPETVQYKVWDEETIQAAIPFITTSNTSMSIAVILLYQGPRYWVYHDVIPLWEQFSRHWSHSVVDAKRVAEDNVKDNNQVSISEDEDASYWNAYNVIADSTTQTRQAIALQDNVQEDIKSEEDYWNAY